MSRALVLLTLLSCLATQLPAMTIRAPRDLDALAAVSDAVVVAEARETIGRERRRLIYSRTTFLVEEVRGGDLEVGQSIDVEVPGGVLGDLEWHVEGAPCFHEGESYRVFLRRADDGTWRPSAGPYGIARVQRAADGSVNLEALWRVTSEASDGGEGGIAGDEFACAYLLSNDGDRRRWPDFDDHGVATVQVSEASIDPLDKLDVVSRALGMWTGITETSLNLSLEGIGEPDIVCDEGRDTARNFIVFDDPCSDIDALDDCRGVIAFGGPVSRGTHRFEGETWSSIIAWGVVVNDGVECFGRENLRVIIAHELGHGLGFGHVDDPSAVMYAGCCREIGATDITCTRVSYPAVDSQNERPSVDAGDDRTIARDSIALIPVISDDGNPGLPGGVQAYWRFLYGPGTAVFDNPDTAETTVHFDTPGRYLLLLSATDGLMRNEDAIVIDYDPDARLPFKRGDTNVDGIVDVSDAVFILHFLFVGGVVPDCLKSADTDGSQQVDISDVSILLSYLFLAGDPPPWPFARCGFERDPTELPCDAFAPCS